MYMTNRIKQYCLLLIALIMLPISVYADKTGSCGANLTYTYVESTKTLTISGTGEMDNWIWDSSVGGAVSPWNRNKYEIVTVIIEDGVQTIGDLAFYDCSSLTTITIPNSVKFIGESAFSKCSSLTSLTLPNSLTAIGSSTFSSCSSITSVSIPSSVTSIGDGAFMRCSNLISMTIPTSVTSIGNSAFKGCTGLTSITIPNSIITIEDYAFENCISLTSVTIPSCITLIDFGVFKGCAALTSITIPNSVTAIKNFAFYDCTLLATIILGSEINEIGSNAFYLCSNLKDFYIYTKNVPMTGDNLFGASNVSSATLHVYEESVSDYKQANNWNLFKKIVALTDNDPKPTGIINIGASEYNTDTYYDLNGVRLSEPNKGVNIIRIKDGKTKKVILK